MPNGALCSPKRLLLLWCLAALREAVGKVWDFSCRTNIGSGACNALPPGTLGTTWPTPARCTSTWPWTSSTSCSSPWPWTSTTTWTSSTTWRRSMASSAAGSVAPVGDSTKDSYIPLFSNRPQDYKEWRQRIVLYKKKLDSEEEQRGNAEPAHVALRCFLATSRALGRQGCGCRGWLPAGVESVGPMLQI